MSISIGMTVFNGERHLKNAIESLLGQSYRDFTLIIINDGSNDSSWEIITKFQQNDCRIKAFQNEKRMGAIYSWNKAYELALTENALYFAWASDHDLWDGAWLQVLSKAIEIDENVALVYPKTIRIDDNGYKINFASPKFTANEVSASSRINSLMINGRGYGDMIYGLFRMSALQSSGVYRRLLVPDTVTIWEISLIGTIQQVDQYLWYRRYVDLFSIARQRRNLFISPPWYTLLPYWVVNPISMLSQCNISINNKRNIMTKNILILKMSLCYGLAFGVLELKRSIRYLVNKLQ
jgi:glycosyltransferase involved in cell wall biosynthesis